MKKPSTKSALLLVDFMNPLDFDKASLLAPRALRAAKHTAELKHKARHKRIHCVYANDNFGNWTSEFSALVQELRSRGGIPQQIAEILKPAKGDLSVLKPRHSAFYGTPLEFLLQDLGISRLIIAGITADICVFATAQDAHIRQFKLWIPSDCVATFTAAHERASLMHMARTMHAETRAALRRKAL
jgi:nicotinamidase-related amidase